MSAARSRTRDRKARVPVQASRRYHAGQVAEAALLALIVVVPIAIHWNSRNMMDVKDIILGLGAGLGLALWLVVSLLEGRLSWPPSRLTTAVLAFLAWAGISVLYSQYPWVAATEFGHLAGNVALFLLVVAGVRTLVQIRRLALAAAISAVAVVVYAFAQLMGHDPLPWATSTSRIFSFLGNATYLAGYLVLVMPLLAAMGWPERAEEATEKTWLGRWWLSLAIGVLLAAMLFVLLRTVTLSAFIGLALGLLIAAGALLVRGGARVLRAALLGMLGLALVLALFSSVAYRYLPAAQQKRVQTVLHFKDPSSEERQLHWRTAYSLFRSHPVVGSGYGTFRVTSLSRMAAEWYQQRSSHSEEMLAPNYAHNEYLQVLADNGAIGGLLFLAVLVLLYRSAFRIALRHPEAAWRRVGLALLVACTAFLVQNFFGVTFRQTGAVTFFWLWLGIAVVGANRVPVGEAGAEATPRRERKFSPQYAGAAGVLVVAALVLGTVGWVSIRACIANVTLREAQHLASRGDLRPAIIVAQYTLDLCPYSAVAYYTLAFAYGQLATAPDVAGHTASKEERQREMQLAVEASERALTLMPGNGAAYFNLGVSYKMSGRLDKAETAMRTAVKLAPVSDHYLGLAETLRMRNKLPEAEQIARTGLDLETKGMRNPDALWRLHVVLAQILYAAHDLPGTVTEFEQAIALKPDDNDRRDQLFGVLYNLPDYARAARAAQEWIDHDPGQVRAWKALGMAQFRLGNREAALQAFTRAKQLDPSLPDPQQGLATMSGQPQTPLDQVGQLERAVAAQPDDPKLREQLVAMLLTRVKDYPRAIEAAQDWIAHSPQQSQAYMYLGYAQVLMKQDATALASLQKAVELDPMNAPARLSLARTLGRLRRVPEAVQELQRVVDTGGDSPSAQQAKKMLEQLAAATPAKPAPR